MALGSKKRVSSAKIISFVSISVMTVILAVVYVIYHLPKEPVEEIFFDPRFEMVSEDAIWFDENRNCFTNMQGERYTTERDVVHFTHTADWETYYYLMAPKKKGSKVYRLYEIDQELTPVLIAEKVNWCWESYEKDYLAYLTGNKKQRGKLHVYDVQNAQSQLVDEKVIWYADAGIALSPNGRYLAYTKMDKAGTDVELYLYDVKEGQSELLTRQAGGLVPMALSNDGKHVFFKDDTEQLSVCSRGEIRNIGVLSQADAEGMIAAWNNTGDQLLYRAEDDSIHFYDAKSKTHRTLSEEGYNLQTMLLQPVWSATGTALQGEGWRTRGYLAVESFQNFAIGTDTGYLYLDQDFLVKRNDFIREGQWKAVTAGEVDASGRKLLFVADGALYKIADTLTEEAPQCLFDKYTVEDFCTDEKYQHIFVLCDENLYYWDGKKELLIAEDVESMAYSPEDESIYYISDGYLYSAEEGRFTDTERRVEADFVETWVDGSIIAGNAEKVYRIEGMHLFILQESEEAEESEEGTGREKGETTQKLEE